MNIKKVVIVGCCTGILATAIALGAGKGDRSMSYAETEQMQRTTISLDAADLQEPHILKVSTNSSSGRLSEVKIKVDGRTISTAKNSPIELNLSPMLGRGKHTIEILGNYSPGDSSVQIEFSGPGTQVSQQTSGNGAIAHTIVVDVQ
ncbi:MAG: hypothetical protein KME17_18410 [Cyanosarcina radialis HA8281-LM2]|jgi:hypothetical protein|nr:hypothetical protein [Cyanosarcina radialis HA8281-LM2]